MECIFLSNCKKEVSVWYEKKYDVQLVQVLDRERVGAHLRELQRERQAKHDHRAHRDDDEDNFQFSFFCFRFFLFISNWLNCVPVQIAVTWLSKKTDHHQSKTDGMLALLGSGRFSCSHFSIID